MKEHWKPITEAPLYAVSDKGRIRRLVLHRNSRCVDGIIKPLVKSRGYACVTIHGRVRPIHRLVADAFLGPLSPGFHTNHIDGVKTNNCLANLEYISAADNQAHAARLGLKSRGQKHYCAKLIDAQVREIRRWRGPKKYGWRTALARRFGVSPQIVSRILERRTWKHL